MSQVLLLVDDEPMNLDMLGRRLVKRGYQVVTAPGGAQALELLKTTPVDLVLLDINMPVMSGIQVLERIRTNHAAHRLPVIMVTANSESEMIVDAIEKGANDYVTKPVDIEVLQARIEVTLAARSELEQAVTPPELASSGQLGPYEVLECLGQGSTGKVYLAHDPRLERKVAVKVLSDMEERRLQRFSMEARALATLSHPGIVEVYDLSLSPVPYYAMELVDGKNLEVYLEGKPLNPRWAADLARQTADALDTVHRAGIFHRDLKPSNLMVDTADRIYLTDFGLARFTDGDLNLTRPGELLGTPAYMAPEQIEPELGPVGGRTDLFALGVILYEMLTGSLPYSSKQLATLLVEIVAVKPVRPEAAPDALADLCLHLLEKCPENRPATAREVADRLGEYLKESC
ncbi:MAG: protein kinase [Candidatus Eremiobacterota bacterium]